jgi:hypothetical protein
MAGYVVLTVGHPRTVYPKKRSHDYNTCIVQVSCMLIQKIQSTVYAVTSTYTRIAIRVRYIFVKIWGNTKTNACSFCNAMTEMFYKNNFLIKIVVTAKGTKGVE